MPAGGYSLTASPGNRLAVGQRTLDIPLRHELLSNFLKSRRQGLSPKTLKFYEGYLRRAPLGIDVTSRHVDDFLKARDCSDGGKHAYFRALRAFYRWLYSPKSGLGLNPQDNLILLLEAPKVGKRILPSLTADQVNVLINAADNPNVWGINHYGIQKMLKALGLHTGIRCDPHTFRHGFVCDLHRDGSNIPEPVTQV